MTSRLVDAGWGKELRDALRADTRELRVVSPFIKLAALKRLLSGRPRSICVITRFNLTDCAEGVSDLAALRALLDAGAQVRGVRNLHAKLYLFGASRAIVTSANLTLAALDRNHELGLVSADDAVIGACRAYFDDLWRRAGRNLTPDRLADWERIVTRYCAAGGGPGRPSGLRDYGTDVGVGDPPWTRISTAVLDAPQALVKFLGEGNNRASPTLSVLDELKSSGCHWAVAYPASRRPRGVMDGAVMFLGRLTEGPNDIRIFGRALAMKHLPGRDDASEADIDSRSWKAKWPRYVRVHHAAFVAGALSNGVSLNALMEQLQADAFESTQRNASRRIGNTDPRQAYRQQAAVQLSAQGASWLNAELQRAFDRHGSIPHEELTGLDWPALPVEASDIGAG